MRDAVQECKASVESSHAELLKAIQYNKVEASPLRQSMMQSRGDADMAQIQRVLGQHKDETSHQIFGP